MIGERSRNLYCSYRHPGHRIRLNNGIPNLSDEPNAYGPASVTMRPKPLPENLHYESCPNQIHGDPFDVLEVVDVPGPKAPGVNEALIGIEIAALTKYDLLSISKALGEGPALPTIVGTEGFGRVLAIGRDVENVKVGDRVIAPPLSQTWREKMIVPASSLFPLPEGDPYQLSMLGSNPPTAALILSEYVQLKPGDWVVQNSANSGVGRSLIAIAKARGLRTINFVRRHELLKELEAAGGDIVLVDEPGAAEEALQLVGDSVLRLGVDAMRRQYGLRAAVFNNPVGAFPNTVCDARGEGVRCYTSPWPCLPALPDS